MKPWIIETENWYTFHRFTFLDGGTVDYWTGDQSCDPNEVKANYNLNCNHSFYRLNDGEWMHQNLFPRQFNVILNANFKSEEPVQNAEVFFLDNITIEPKGQEKRCRQCDKLCISKGKVKELLRIAFTAGDDYDSFNEFIEMNVDFEDLT